MNDLKCDTGCQECMIDPHFDCIIEHEYVWMKIYEPLYRKCVAKKKPCKGLKKMRDMRPSKIHSDG